MNLEKILLKFIERQEAFNKNQEAFNQTVSERLKNQEAFNKNQEAFNNNFMVFIRNQEAFNQTVSERLKNQEAFNQTINERLTNLEVKKVKKSTHSKSKTDLKIDDAIEKNNEIVFKKINNLETRVIKLEKK
ncbi:MAG: hypothetical protein ACRCVI_00805 [Mycoplasmoidaceae bacterium]